MLSRTGFLAAGFGALSTLLLYSGHAASTTYPRVPVDSFARLCELFGNPPHEYRTLPFIVWNGEVTEQEIEKHLADFEAQGLGGVFIHPRPGLITEYLSDRWFALSRYTVDRAAKRGMQAWLYDENSYPSGFAGGHVPASMPESWNEGQGLVPEKLTRVDPAKAASYKLVLKREGDGFREIPAAEGAAPGEYWAFTLAFYPKRSWHGGYSYVDLIRPGVTEKFIEITMRGYEKTLGQDFGKTVPGIFTDEPGIQPPAPRSLRWTPDLFVQFQKRWGYDLKPLLPALYEEVGDWRRVRHNYWGLLLELFVERWSKPWRRYTDSKGLAWTGHYWEHEWPNVLHGPDNMAMYSWHHVPGIDMLFNQFRDDMNAQFGNVRSVKELSSVANQMGTRRTLSETYGGGGWELRFEDMKRLGDWQAALGVNMVNQHLAFQTIMGARKYDYPQSFTYHSPWWKHYKTMGDYGGRLSLALSTGEQVNRVLIVEPTTSAWMYASPASLSESSKQLGAAFQAFVTRLEAMQGEYDLGSENVMKAHGRVQGKRMAVGRRAYDLVVLAPGTQSLDASTAKLLAEYVEAGGEVLSFVDPPARVDGRADDRVVRLAKAGQWRRVASIDEAAAKLVPSDIREVAGHLVHQRRRMKDGELFFFANSNLEQRAGAILAVSAKSLTRLDLFTGAREAYPVNGGKARIDLAPGGSVLLIASNAAPAAPAAPPAFNGSAVASSAPTAVKRTGPNMLRIDYCDLKLGGATENDIYFYVAQEKVFKHFGMETNPWNHAIQYKRTIVDGYSFASDSSFEATFRFEVDASLDTSGLRAVVERPSMWRVSVNGRPVEPRPGEWWLDRAFGVYDIGSQVKKGSNEILLRASQMSVHHELEPVILSGEFGVSAQDKGWKLTAAAPLSVGAWKEQRLPQYPHSVSYSRAVTLKSGGRAMVRLGKWNGTMAEVRVNGKSAGVIGCQPYEAEIGKLVRDGSNQVEVTVYGSLKNLFGPHHGKINRGLTGPGSFRTAPAHTPSGAAYDLDAYGLLEDFEVLTGHRSLTVAAR